MRALLKKEARLSASPLAYVFTVFGLMFFLPGYPVLCGAFFTTLGLFQSCLYAREAGDTMFSALLPIAKRDVAYGRYLFFCLIELASFCLMTVAVVIRMTLLSDAAPYRENALMNANLFALGMALLIFALFNAVFLGGFFRTGYALTKPFIVYGALAFVIIGASETVHHIPGFETLNAFGTDSIGLQVCLLLGCAVASVLITLLSCRRSAARFEAIDL